MDSESDERENDNDNDIDLDNDNDNDDNDNDNDTDMLTGFLFGNVDSKGELENDVLDHESKKQLASLAR